MNADTFLHAIQESPDDDLPRWVFADWLEENGQAERSEFIRLQCQLAAGAGGEERPALLRREQDLLTRHAGAWLGPFCDLRGAWKYERGTARVRLSARRMVSARQVGLAEEWFARGHVLALELYGGMQGRERLMAASFLARLVSFSLANAGLDDHSVQAVASCPHLAGLGRLALDNSRLGHEGARALARSPHLGRVEELSLRSNGLSLYGVQELGTGFPRLRRLDLSHVLCGPEGARHLVQAGWLGNLTHLRLRGCRLGHQGVRLLAGSGRLAGLRLLDLRNNEVGAMGVLALAQSPHLDNVQTLLLDEPRGIDAVSWSALRERFGPALKNGD
jgi:uncharacterized protein (TIGR02996 family)